MPNPEAPTLGDGQPAIVIDLEAPRVQSPEAAMRPDIIERVGAALVRPFVRVINWAERQTALEEAKYQRDRAEFDDWLSRQNQR